jgi:hypothetical protein
MIYKNASINDEGLIFHYILFVKQMDHFASIGLVLKRLGLRLELGLRLGLGLTLTLMISSFDLVLAMRWSCFVLL